ncbi:MAG: DUF4124 domain-containing protein [Myxococcales bacterium]|nr:DUF4124 domain-containing protein [Myxococcales bacterium]
MNWSSNKNWAVRMGAVTLAFVLGASASAGTLYSWKTEDGTFAYTNDKKRVPARYKNQAEASKFKSMESYARFTPGPKIEDKAYEDRIVERLEVLRASADRAVSSGGATQAEQPYFVRLELGGGGRHGSGTSIEIPVGAGMDDSEPVVVEHVRMKPGKGHAASRHFRIVKQGDRVLAVIKDRHSDSRLTSSLSEEDFDSNPLN